MRRLSPGAGFEGLGSRGEGLGSLISCRPARALGIEGGRGLGSGGENGPPDEHDGLGGGAIGFGNMRWNSAFAQIYTIRTHYNGQ